jgi:hypothetical protein
VHEAVSGDLARTIKIEDRRGSGLQAVPLLLTTVRLSEPSRVRAMAVLRPPGLAKNDEEGSANTLRGLRPRDWGQRGENGGGKALGGLGQLQRGIAAG